MYRTAVAVAAACLYEGADAQLILQRPAAQPAGAVMARPAEQAAAPVMMLPMQAGMDERMKKRCEWMKKAVASGRAEQLSRNPRFVQIKDMCEKLWEKAKGEDVFAVPAEMAVAQSAQAQEAANVEKEAIETKCAWLHKVKETRGVDKIKDKPWFQEVEELCSGVPLAEMEDNAMKIMDQKCVWFDMAKQTGKLAGQRGEKWYLEMEEKCAPVAGQTHEEAQKMATKLQGAYSVAKKLFGKVAAGGPREDEDDEAYGDDYDGEEYDYDNSEIQV